MKRRNFLALFGAAIAMPFVKATSVFDKKREVYSITLDGEQIGTAPAYQFNEVMDHEWMHIATGTDDDGNRVYYRL